MKILILLLFTLITLLGNGQANKKSFEGKITYKVSFSPQTANEKYNEYQKQKYGSEVEYLYSENGDFKISYKNSGSKGYDFIIYNKSLNKVFSKFKNIDTIYSYNPIENALKLIDQNDGKPTSINGKSCSTFSISGVEPNSKQKVQLVYSYLYVVKLI